MLAFPSCSSFRKFNLSKYQGKDTTKAAKLSRGLGDYFELFLFGGLAFTDSDEHSAAEAIVAEVNLYIYPA